MESEVLFLKYAFPCSFILRQREEISQEQFNELEDAAINNKILSRELLEKIFFRAFKRMKPIAEELNKDKWSIEVIKEYFITGHNKIIQEGQSTYKKAPDSLRNLCQVHRAKILQIKENVLIVEYDNGKRRPVLNDLIPKVKEGDFVTIHYGYAAEKVD